MRVAVAPGAEPLRHTASVTPRAPNGHSVAVVCVAATLVLVVVLVLGGPGSARASCAALSDAEQRALADVVFEGVALAGEIDNGTLLSPARFRVDRYLKGSGSGVVQVTTAYESSGPFGLLGTSLVSTVGITPRPGERWRILAQTKSENALDTSICLGSERLDGAPPAGAAAPAGGVGASQGMPWPWVAIPAVLVAALVGLAAHRAWAGPPVKDTRRHRG